ncbi:MAG: hypothetical protein HKN43_03205 [Rhodothermales bacterium]|nr:hypothetical protein [Rhodothermales bacterium]
MKEPFRAGYATSEYPILRLLYEENIMTIRPTADNPRTVHVAELGDDYFEMELLSYELRALAEELTDIANRLDAVP